MDTGDQQVELLRSIWNEMKAVRGSFETRLEAVRDSFETQLMATRQDLGARIDQTNQRLEQTNERLDSIRSELKEELDGVRKRVVESEVRLATATTGLSNDIRDLHVLIRDWREEHRADRADLRSRVDRIEAHLGIGTQRQ